MRRSHLAIVLVLAALMALGLGLAVAELQGRAPDEGDAGMLDKLQESTDVDEVGEQEFEIGIIGDIPYNLEEQRKTDVLFRQMNGQKLAFVVHVGDIKSGDSPCTDEIFFRERERFENSANPLVYVPGDNEWTDCGNTGYDLAERLLTHKEDLERLREIFFVGEESLG